MFIRNCTNISTEEHSSSVCSWRTASTYNTKSTGKIVIIRMFTKNFINKSASKLSLGGFLWAGPTCKQRNCQTGSVVGEILYELHQHIYTIKLSWGGSFSTAPTYVQANCQLSSSGCSLLTSLTKLKNNHLFLENYREVYYELTAPWHLRANCHQRNVHRDLHQQIKDTFTFIGLITANHTSKPRGKNVTIEIFAINCTNIYIQTLSASVCSHQLHQKSNGAGLSGTPPHI